MSNKRDHILIKSDGTGSGTIVTANGVELHNISKIEFGDIVPDGVNSLKVTLTSVDLEYEINDLQIEYK